MENSCVMSHSKKILKFKVALRAIAFNLMFVEVRLTTL